MDTKKNKSDPLWMQRGCSSSIPLTGFVPCVKPKQGMSKEILSLLCPTSVDSNMQMTFYKINRGQGLAPESQRWHPRHDHGGRGQTERKPAVLGFPLRSACLCLLQQLNFFHIELERAKMWKIHGKVQNARQWIQEFPDPCKIMQFY